MSTDFPNTLKQLRIRSGLTQAQLAAALGVGKSTISMYEVGAREPDFEMLERIADYFNVDMIYLLRPAVMSITETPVSFEKMASITELSDMQLIKFPIIGSISAGYNSLAVEEYTGEYELIPVSALSAPASEYFVLRIKGDSMYPKLLDGDTVLVRRTNSIDNGKIAVMIYNGEEATVKRVHYVKGQDWLELIPANPEYQTKRIENADLEQCCVLGEVVKLMRDM